MASHFSLTVLLVIGGSLTATLGQNDALQAALGLDCDDVCMAVQLLQTHVTMVEMKAGQVAPATAQVAAPPAFWAAKGGTMNHSGYSPWVGTHNMSTPSWTWNEPDLMHKGATVPVMKVFHGSPVIDGSSNVLIQSTTGWVYSVDPSGALRWSLELSGGNPGNIALKDGVAYTCAEDGQVWAIDTVTGTALWNSKVADSCPGDTHSLTATGDLVITACSFGPHAEGNSDICAVSALNGSLRWTYSMAERHNARCYNQAHNVVGDSIVFNDNVGSVYRVSLVDGSEIWYHSHVLPLDQQRFSTAGLIMGPNNMAYHALNTGPAEGGPAIIGVVRTYDVTTGAVLWNRTFSEGVNAVPAVGPFGPDGRIVVAVAVGNNVECLPLPMTTQMKHAQVKLLDATTGVEIWDFDFPPYDKSCAGNLPWEICCPDVFGQPTLAADGTVYVNWSGGASYSLRDTNGDGKVDIDDPAETSVYHHGKGSNGNTAFAPHLMVAVSCTQLIGYST